MNESLDSLTLEMDRSELLNVAKPLLYSYTALAALSMVAFPRYAGNMIGLAMIPAIAVVSAGLSESVKGDWQKVLDLISVLSILTALLLGSYVSMSFAY